MDSVSHGCASIAAPVASASRSLAREGRCSEARRARASAAHCSAASTARTCQAREHRPHHERCGGC
eukprot:1188140-Prorocentrum_minimum.AAC.3